MQWKKYEERGQLFLTASQKWNVRTCDTKSDRMLVLYALVCKFPKSIWDLRFSGRWRCWCQSPRLWLGGRHKGFRWTQCPPAVLKPLQPKRPTSTCNIFIVRFVYAYILAAISRSKCKQMWNRNSWNPRFVKHKDLAVTL